MSQALSVYRLNLFNAVLFLKRYWRGPRSQEVGEEGGGEGIKVGYFLRYSHHPNDWCGQNDSCIKTGGDESRFSVFISCEGKFKSHGVHKPQLLK